MEGTRLQEARCDTSCGATHWLRITFSRGHESRAAERTTRIRHSADVEELNDRTTKRWPDLILEHTDGRRIVLELERMLKGTTPARAHHRRYRDADWFDDDRPVCPPPSANAPESPDPYVLEQTAAVSG